MDENKDLLTNLNTVHYDVLKEISNIGASHAASALAIMIGKKISVGMPNVNLLEFKDVPAKVGGAESQVVGLLVKISGDVQGIMMFLLAKKSACMLIKELLNSEKTEGDDFSDIELSAIQEIGNILSGSYLSSLSTLTNLKIKSSVPYLSIDMAGAILSVPAIEFSKVGDKVLFIESRLWQAEEEDFVSGYFLLVPDMRSFNVIMNSLGVV